MKLLKQRYFPNLFVAIMVENNDTFLLARIIKNGVVKKSYEATFENQEYLKALNHSVVDYLVARQTDVLDTYMAVFANSKSQGLVPTLDLVELEKYGINPSHIKQISLTKDAMVYVPYSEINITREYFKQTGIDLLYSPFAIFHNMLERK